jgi:hypothetical protein
MKTRITRSQIVGTRNYLYFIERGSSQLTLSPEEVLLLLHQLQELEMTIMNDVGVDKPSGPE